MTLLRRIWFFVTRWRRMRELDDEMRLHVELRTAANRRLGVEPPEAARQARMRFGNPLKLREEARDMWGFSELERTVADLRYAGRRAVHRPARASIVVLTLALGIGTATAIFSVVDAVLLRPLPWKDPDRLVSIWIVRPQWVHSPALAAAATRGFLTWPNFRDVQQQSHSPEAIGVWATAEPILNQRVDEVTHAIRVSSSFLPMLGVQPYTGRFFERSEDEQPTDSVIVSYETWQSRFGGDPGVLGRRVELDERQRTIVGVLPKDFRFSPEGVAFQSVVSGQSPEFVLPFGSESSSNRSAGNGSYRAVGRLKSGVTLQDALRDLEPILRGSEKPEERTARLERLVDTEVAESRRPLWMLFAGATLLLLISCTNVAGLLVGDAAARRQEMAVRTALGAGRRQLVRALFAESATLGIGGAAVGVLAARVLTPAVIALAPASLPQVATAGLNARVLAFAIGLMLLTTLIFGVAPVFALSPAAPAGSLRDARSATPGRQRIRSVLVVVEVALAVVLLSATVLLGETVVRLAGAPTGFDPENLLVFSIRGPRTPDDTATSRLQRARSLQERFARIPGVTGATATATAPFGGRYGTNTIDIDGETSAESLSAARQVVMWNYLQTVRAPLIKGRYFSAHEGEAVALVSEAFEERYLRGRAIDRRFRFGGDTWYRVIGVVRDAKQRSKADDNAPAFYVLDTQAAGFEISQFVLRTTVDPRTVIPAVREAVRSQDGRLVVAQIDTMTNLIRRSMAPETFRATLSGIFGGAALLLAAGGLYALLSCTVADRLKEIALRMALGARPHDVLTLILSQGAMLVVLGLIAGIPAALATSRILSRLLFGVTAADARTYLLVAAVLSVVSILAMALPAWRASRIDPMVALKES